MLIVATGVKISIIPDQFVLSKGQTHSATSTGYFNPCYCKIKISPDLVLMQLGCITAIIKEGKLKDTVGCSRKQNHIYKCTLVRWDKRGLTVVKGVNALT